MKRNLKRLIAPTVAVALVAVIGFSMQPRNASAGVQEQEPQPKPQVYDETADAREDIVAAVAAAKKENRRVLIQWGANWCGWCIKLHDLYGSDREISRKLLYEYDVVLVDIGRWDKNLDLVEKYGADITGQGVPYLTVLDGNGDVVANQDTGSLEEGDHHDPAKVLGFLTSVQAEYVNAKEVLGNALEEAEATGRRAFLHFGAPWCGWCKRMERWLAREKVAEIWALDFVDVKIDVDRMVGGKDVQDNYTGGYGGIPWFAVLDAEGKTLFDSMILPGNRNVGCPWSFQELRAFADYLDRVAINITPEARQVLMEEMLLNRIEEEAARNR